MNKDPYRYFRVEARELLEKLGSGVLELERSGAAAETVARLLRLAHTLKGAARVVRQREIAESAHSLEDLLQPHRQGGGALPGAGVAELLRLLDAMRGRLAALDEPQAVVPSAAPAGGAPSSQPPSAAAAPGAPEDQADSLRVEVDDLDVLLARSAEAGVRLGALGKEANALDRLRRVATTLAEAVGQVRPGGNGTRASPAARALGFAETLRTELQRLQRTLADGIEAVERDVGAVREAAEQMRLLPASTLLPGLERALRDAAQATGREARFESAGGEHRLDAHVLGAVRDALLHVVRNAVGHGIELPEARRAAGKPPAGRVELRVERRGPRVAFVCSDDGRGLDLEAIRRAAVRARAVAEPEAASCGPDELVRLLLRGGLSTAEAVTEVSGRGVGLDVLRETAAQLNAQVAVRSEPGRGTEFELVVPVSLSSVPTLLADTGAAVAAIPLDAVRCTLRVADAEIARSADGDTLVFEGKGIPFLPLAHALGRPAPAARSRAWSAVVVQAAAGVAALGVERLLGTANVVVRPLPALVDPQPVVRAVALDGEGNPQLVLDPDGLVRAAAQGEGPRDARSPAPRPPVLIVDDSLTTRMLEQGILESAGYAVDLATSGEEALAKARQRPYSLFIVDVEMPGMNGFEFIQSTRADAELRKTPALLVTSLAGEADRRRGLQAGASAYIAKSEFDQGQLLETIRGLIG